MSAPKRFFVEGINYPQNSVIYISGEEFIHAKTVLRVEEGTEITLLDGLGNEYTAIVAKIEKKQLLAHITGSKVGDKEPNTKIYLLVGALKGDKTELVIQKACELGVHKIGVFRSRFCSAYVNENKLDRMNKVAREAAKQCLRSVAPEVVFFDDFTLALKSAEEYKNKLFFCEFAEGSECDMSKIEGSTALIVGSEGGFCEEEYALARSEYGFLGMSLGKRILRAETAAITAVAIAAFSLGEMR